MIQSVAAYTASTTKQGVTAQRSFCGIVDSITTRNFEELAEWLTEFYPNTMHVCWRLADFSKAICSLLSAKDQETLSSTSRLIAGNVKLFSVDRWFGVTVTKNLGHGNQVEKRETNFFGMEQFALNDTPMPTTIAVIEKEAVELLRTLDSMGQTPTRFTSPVGVFAESLGEKPTVYSNQDRAFHEACLYAEVAMRREWRSAYQIGYFPKTYSFDLRSGYPAMIRDLPDTDNCTVKYSKGQWLKSDFAVVKANVDVLKDYTPIVYDSDLGEHTLPTGPRLDIFSGEELIWLARHDAAKIEFIDGYFFKFHGDNKPYKEPIENLYNTRLTASNLRIAEIARKVGQGISGKLDQDSENGDGTVKLGDFYNPIYALMTRSRCRLRVADFIWNNALQDSLVVVQVDGILTTRRVEVPESNEMGHWRMDDEGESLVLGKGEIWRKNKRPLDIGMAEIMAAFRAKPQASFYQIGDKFVDLRVMAMNNERVYDKFPKNGYQALNQVSGSKSVVLK